MIVLGVTCISSACVSPLIREAVHITNLVQLVPRCFAVLALDPIVNDIACFPLLLFTLGAISVPHRPKAAQFVTHYSEQRHNAVRVVDNLVPKFAVECNRSVHFVH